MTSAVDYSFSRPAPAAIKAAGCAGVVRYTSGQGKAITATEAQSILGNGLWLALVHEGSSGDAKLGGSKGAQDASGDRNYLDKIGCPRSPVVFYACDQFCTVDEVRPYFQGVRTTAVRPVGWYGGLGVGLQLHAEGLVDWVWAANATSWSGYSSFAELETAAHVHGIAMLQHLDHPFAGIPAGAYDYDEVITPFPVWGFTPTERPVLQPTLNITLDSPITGYLEIENFGAWLVTASGEIVTLAGNFYGTPFGKPYWAGQTAAGIAINPVVANRLHSPYIIVATDGHTYGIAGF
jgi:hypothetical protein